MPCNNVDRYRMPHCCSSTAIGEKRKANGNVPTGVVNRPNTALFTGRYSLLHTIFHREVHAHCIRGPVYNVVLGNIKGAVALGTSKLKSNIISTKSSGIDRGSTQTRTPNRKARQASRGSPGVPLPHLWGQAASACADSAIIPSRKGVQSG